ncbi:DUF952 domain-containing protein [Streptomyces adustus]|uniref:DUF952 domain-containing protein n=1 Tax=Streptomyces adustus TaxID=1609272 RepID=UPI0037156536
MRPASATSLDVPLTPEPTHITERSLWDAARETGTYETPTRSRTLQEEGFIHRSTRAELPVPGEALAEDTRAADRLFVGGSGSGLNALERQQGPTHNHTSEQPGQQSRKNRCRTRNPSGGRRSRAAGRRARAGDAG